MEESFHPVLQTCTVHLRDNYTNEWVHSWICRTRECQTYMSFKTSLLQTVVVVSSSSYTRHRQLAFAKNLAKDAYAEHTRHQPLQPQLAVCSQLAIFLGLHVYVRFHTCGVHVYSHNALNTSKAMPRHEASIGAIIVQ